MHKTIAFYQPLSGVDWPDSIWDAYSRQISRHGVPHFEAGSGLDAAFQDSLADLGFNALRQTIEVCTGERLSQHPYHYLTVQQDEDYSIGDVFDRGEQCPGDAQVHCTSGIRQKAKVWIDSEKSRDLDIMEVPSSPRPRLLLISPRLKRLLVASDLTGFSCIPCLRVGEHYSAEEAALYSDSERLGELAPLFQLMVTSATSKPPSVGEIYSIFNRCRKCGTVYGAYFAREPLFEREDLDAGTDIQKFDSYETENHERIGIAGERFIVSWKFLSFLQRSGIRGLASYLTDPPVKHGVVELR